MKRTYIAPSAKTISLKASAILAGSPDYGGENNGHGVSQSKRRYSDMDDDDDE